MTFVTVRVTAPRNRLIYINGGYTEAAGNSLNDSFVVPTGGNVFETLTGKHCVDFRKTLDLDGNELSVTVELDPVDPPEQI